MSFRKEVSTGGKIFPGFPYKIKNMDDYLDLAIKMYRKIAGLTVNELAEKLGVSSKTVQLWEDGITSPPCSKARAICEVLHVDANELLSISEHDQEMMKKLRAYDPKVCDSAIDLIANLCRQFAGSKKK